MEPLACEERRRGLLGSWKKKKKKRTNTQLYQFPLHHTSGVTGINKYIPKRDANSCLCGKLHCLQSVEPQTVPTDRVWWFTDAHWNEMAVPWKSAWTVFWASSLRYALSWTAKENESQSWKTHAGSHSWPFWLTSPVTWTLNLQLQGRDELPSNMLNAVRAFQNKITAMYIPDREFIHSPKLRAVTTNDPSLQQHFSHRELVNVLEELRGDLNPDSQMWMNFIENPFHVDVSSFTLTITLLCPSQRAAVESENVLCLQFYHFKVELRAGVGHF